MHTEYNNTHIVQQYTHSTTMHTVQQCTHSTTIHTQYNAHIVQQYTHSTNIQQGEEYLHQQVRLRFKEESSRSLNLEDGFKWRWILDTSESRSEMPWKLWNAVLEIEGKDQLDRSCKNGEVLNRFEMKLKSYIKQNEGRLIILVRPCVETDF
jgi:hypothetical protein